MHQKLQGFPKAEHLCLKKEIEALFAPGSFSAARFPVRLVCRAVEYDGHGPKAKVMVIVSKRHLRHAVDRNRSKRQMREAYRLRKQQLFPSIPEGKALHMAFIWMADKQMPSARVASAVNHLLLLLAERLSATAAS